MLLPHLLDLGQVLLRPFGGQDPVLQAHKAALLGIREEGEENPELLGGQPELEGDVGPDEGFAEVDPTLIGLGDQLVERPEPSVALPAEAGDQRPVFPVAVRIVIVTEEGQIVLRDSPPRFSVAPFSGGLLGLSLIPLGDVSYSAYPVLP